MEIDVGQVIAGKYELVRLLGKGAMGEVWLANHTSLGLGGQFAIKLIDATDDAEAETASGRFQLEAQIAAKLSRKTRHIVAVSDHGEENGLAYLVMELLEGQSLDSRVQQSGAGPMPLNEVAAMVSQVVRALSLAHEEGIFHRDLKPANIWLGRDEDGRLVVKLLDFGIARSLKPFRVRSPFATSKDMVLGTPSYMSPEQARGLDTLDHRCDLWALAVVAYEALTQTIPFEGTTIEDIFLSVCTFRYVPIHTYRADLPPALADFFAKAFASDIDRRFQSAAEMAAVFEQLVSPEALEAALGTRAPASPRRLETAHMDRPGQSSALPQQDPNPPLNSHPNLAPHGVSGTGEALVARGSSPDFPNVALTDTVQRRRGGAMLWVVAVVALFAMVAIGTLVVGSLRSPVNATTLQPVAPTVTALTTPVVTPSSTAEPVPTTTTTPITNVTSLPPPKQAPSPPSPSHAKTVVAVLSSAPPAPTPPKQDVPTTTTPPPPSPPPPAPAKSVNKSELF